MYLVPVTKFLFWNLNRKPLEKAVSELADIHAVDIVVLAECPTEPGSLIQALNEPSRGEFEYPRASGLYITVLTRFSREFLHPVFESGRISIRRLTFPGCREILIAAVHLPSKLHWSNESQSIECTTLARQIAEAEDKLGHQRTILLGDFNMNPFESGLVAAGGLNSVMSRATAAKSARTVQGREYRFFYAD